jgi:hypothetical protein
MYAVAVAYQSNYYCTDYKYMLCHWRNKFTVLSQNTMGMAAIKLLKLI